VEDGYPALGNGSVVRETRGSLPKSLKPWFKEQGGTCALCSEPGSAGGLMVDRDDLKKRIRGLVHPKCKAFLALGRDNPVRFSMAITYLGRRAPTLSAPAIKA
jgi:hypothetical protein